MTVQNKDTHKEGANIKEVGLWIDHRKAVIVSIVNKSVVAQEIKSDVGDAGRGSGDKRTSNSNDTHGSTAEDMRDRKFGNSLDRYYDEVITHINDAESIWIFGPGEAKAELENRLRRAGLGARVVGIETVDKMTTRQLAVKVQTRFQKK